MEFGKLFAPEVSVFSVQEFSCWFPSCQVPVAIHSFPPSIAQSPFSVKEPSLMLVPFEYRRAFRLISRRSLPWRRIVTSRRASMLKQKAA